MTVCFGLLFFCLCCQLVFALGHMLCEIDAWRPSSTPGARAGVCEGLEEPPAWSLRRRHDFGVGFSAAAGSISVVDTPGCAQVPVAGRSVAVEGRPRRKIFHDGDGACSPP